ncbi:MAG: hypothetical protein ABEI99_03000 [Halobaculum sp.]
MVVLTTDTGEYRAVAESIADSRGERVVSTLSEVGAGDVVYVDSPTEIDEATLLELQRRQCRSDGTANFGVVTGYTPTAAEALYTRDLGARSDHYVVNNHHSIPHVGDEGLTALPNDETEGVTASLRTEAMESLAVATGGHSMHYYLPDGFLCGFPESGDVAGYGDRQPACVTDGARECPLRGELVATEAVDATHVFVSSCASIIANNNIDLPVHVGLGLLTQVESLIGSYRILSSFPHEVYLYHGLVRDGYELGQVCYLLNRYSASISNKIYPYFLYGRPRNRSADATTGSHQVSVDQSGSAVATVTVTDIDCHVVDLSLPVEDEDVAVDVSSPDGEGPFYHAAFPENDGLRVLVYAGGRLSLDRLEVRVEREATERRRADALFACARNLRTQNGVGLLTEKMRNQLTHTENILHTLAPTLESTRFRSDTLADLREKLDEADEVVEGIYDELHAELADANFLLYEYHDRVVKDGSTVNDDGCSDCGTPVFVWKLTEPVTAETRAVGICPRCGYRYDVPASAGDTHPTVTTLPSGDVAERRFRIECHNPRGEFAKGMTVPSLVGVDHEAATAEGVFDPACHRFTLRSDETYASEFTVDVDDLPANEYYLFVNVVLNGEIFVAEHTFSVGGADGRIPEYLLE